MIDSRVRDCSAYVDGRACIPARSRVGWMDKLHAPGAIIFGLRLRQIGDSMMCFQYCKRHHCTQNGWFVSDILEYKLQEIQHEMQKELWQSFIMGRR